MAKRLLILSAPFLAGALFILFVDPYNYFNLSRLISDDAKRSVAAVINPTFWKLNEYERAGGAKILLGDSRMIAMNAAEIKRATGEDYVNLAYGGGNVREAIETFWLAAKKNRLEKVYFGINLDKYNDYEILDRTIVYKSTKENSFLYFLNPDVWNAAYYNAEIRLTGEKFNIGVPNMTKADFWVEAVDAETNYYRRYAEPNKYREELRKLSRYCRENRVELTFVIFPTHVDLQRLVDEIRVRAQREAMLDDLLKFGDVFDFDWENEMTANAENFSDPFHFNKRIAEEIVSDIWLGEGKYAKFYRSTKSQ